MLDWVVHTTVGKYWITFWIRGATLWSYEPQKVHGLARTIDAGPEGFGLDAVMHVSVPAKIGDVYQLKVSSWYYSFLW